MRPLVWDENGVLYIVRGYEPWMQGRIVPDDYVVRPRNHKWCGKYGGETFRAWSTERCPTYGTCNNCYASGPVGLRCVNPECNEHYLVAFHRGNKDFSVTLDLQWISMFMGASHTLAMADRVQAWLRTPCQYVSTDHMFLVLMRNATHLKTDEER